MAYTTIDDPSAYFHTQLYTGSSSGQSITNDANAGDFKPDWVWIKRRDGDPNAVGNGHNEVFDSSRGVTKELYADLTSAEATTASSLTAFGTDGFTVGTEARVNSNGLSFVAWQWKANGGTTTDGSSNDSVSTSNHQANTTAGFSIVSYTGNNSAGATVAHGLGAAPTVLIVKNRDSDRGWMVYHHKNTSAPATEYLWLDDNNATSDYEGSWNDTDPTSTVFSVGNSNETNENNSKHIAYCFAEKQGYSKFGSYTGNGSTDGPFIYTGFKPAWVLIRQTSTAQNWILYDNKINPFNEAVTKLSPNLSGVEDSSTGNNDIDMLSNGFKVTEDNNDMNESGQNFIYMAFAEHPFVSSKGVPVTAR